MKTLVAYYSQTGNTKKVAEKIAKELDADLEEIQVEGKNEQFEEVKINYEKNPEDYDLVIVGTPVWAFNPTPAVKEYLKENKEKLKETAFFCTYKLFPCFTFGVMKSVGKKPKSMLKINSKKIDSSEDKIKQFCEGLK